MKGKRKMIKRDKLGHFCSTKKTVAKKATTKKVVAKDTATKKTSAKKSS